MHDLLLILLDVNLHETHEQFPVRSNTWQIFFRVILLTCLLRRGLKGRTTNFNFPLLASVFRFTCCNFGQRCTSTRLGPLCQYFRSKPYLIHMSKTLLTLQQNMLSQCINVFSNSTQEIQRRKSAGQSFLLSPALSRRRLRPDCRLRREG